MNLAAGLWERRILPARCDEYDARWLDELSMSGELAWGRLCPPRKDADDGPSGAGLTRAAPITLLLRENLGWLLPRERHSAEAHCRAGAAAVLETLRQRGALFQHEIMALTGLLPVATRRSATRIGGAGLGHRRRVYGSAIDFGHRHRASPRRKTPPPAPLAARFHRRHRAAGRCFPGIVATVGRTSSRHELGLATVATLGRRVSRSARARNACAAVVDSLVQVYRRLEARGEIRGGRFVRGVAGEQYAMPEAVELLRSVRDEKPDDKTIVLAAADPVNLCGLITDEPRIPQHAHQHRGDSQRSPGRRLPGRRIAMVWRNRPP